MALYIYYIYDTPMIYCYLTVILFSFRQYYTFPLNMSVVVSRTNEHGNIFCQIVFYTQVYKHLRSISIYDTAPGLS